MGQAPDPEILPSSLYMLSDLVVNGLFCSAGIISPKSVPKANFHMLYAN